MPGFLLVTGGAGFHGVRKGVAERLLEARPWRGCCHVDDFSGGFVENVPEGGHLRKGVYPG